MAEFFSIDLEAEVSARLSLYSDKLQEVIDRKFKLTPTYKQLFSKINHGMLDDNGNDNPSVVKFN